MTREEFPKRKASMSKPREVRAMLIRGRERRLRAMAYKDAIKITRIEGQRCGVNGGQE